MKKILALLAVLLLSAPARAIELSLEENRAERGGVGFVDMQRLFAASPDAQRAKESFEELVRQAEERVNLRKAELLRLRKQLDLLRADRDALAKTYVEPPPPTAPPPLPAAPAKPLPLPGTTRQVASSSGPAVAVSTAAPPVMLSAASPAVALSTAFPVLALSTASAPVAVSTASALVAVSTSAASVAVSTGPTLGQSLLELDGKIVALQADAARKEAELANEHDDADRGLLDVESRKTDQVLARIYRAISDVSRLEGVSVVVDKTTILYGRSAVDLTDKVLKHLRENPPQP